MNAGTPKEGTKYFMSGCPFVAPGEQTWDLAKLKLVGGSYSDETLSLMKDTVPAIDGNKVFQYWSAEEEGDDNENVGWYFKGGENDGQKVETYPIPVGTGFMVYLRLRA